MATREELARKAFELNRDIEYQKFREIYFDSYGATKKYPDPESREVAMREFWNRTSEQNLPAYDRHVAGMTAEQLRQWIGTMEGMVASHGDLAWELVCDEHQIIAVELERERLAMNPAERNREPVPSRQLAKDPGFEPEM